MAWDLLGNKIRQWLRLIPPAFFLVWLSYFVFINIKTPISFWLYHGDAWMRYLIAFPGSLLTMCALLLQRAEIRTDGLVKLSRDIIWLSVFFGLFAFLDGLIIAAPLPFFPANVLNEFQFYHFVDIKIDLIRTVVGIGMFILTLRLFNLEADRQFEELKEKQAINMERERISMDLHDGVLQTLYGLGMRLSNCSDHLPAGSDYVQQEISEITSEINHAIQAARNYILNLKDFAISSPDLLHGLNFLSRKMERKTGIIIALESSVSQILLNPEQHYQVYHIVAEALNNVEKHARATRVNIQVQLKNEHLMLKVSDNGIGFKTDRIFDGRHQGLVNMQKRARPGGNIVYHSAPGEGTTVVLNLQVKGSTLGGG